MEKLNGKIDYAKKIDKNAGHYYNGAGSKTGNLLNNFGVNCQS
jgi:hypothetical protein